MHYQLNVTSETKPLPHYWEMCVGSCHAATALREDYRRQLKKCRAELGFEYVRFHGLFDDDMSVLKKSVLSGEYKISFSNIDNIFDFLLSIGMKPFVELSFMPECLKTADYTIFHYKGNITPPSDTNVWARFIRTFIEHLLERYGKSEVRKWFFEVWNEPNLGGENGINGGRFWSGSMRDYFELYSLTVRAVKSVDGALKVGGPATSNNAHIPDMIAYCKETNTPIDFISTHHYPTDVVLGYGVEDSQNFVTKFNKSDPNDKQSLQKLLTEYVTFQKDIWKKVDRGVLTDMAKRAKEECGDLPLYYTEWSSLAGLESDGAFGSSFIAKTVMDNIGLVEGYAYWTFSDIFEEAGFPNSEFHGGYGLLTLNGVGKAPYRAFQLLKMLGGQIYSRSFSEGTVDVYAIADKPCSAVQLLAVNHNSLLHDIKEETLEITLSGGDFCETAELIRVDDTHSNPLKKWRELGSPQYIDERQKFLLMAESELQREKITLDTATSTLTLTLPAMGTALVTVYLKK